MITRSQSGIWHNAMYDEYNALVKNGTWLLVPRPAGVNMVRSMWLFKHKFHADGTLSRYKARLVANGSSQQLGVDFDETFSHFSNQPLFARFLALLCLVFRLLIFSIYWMNIILNSSISSTIDKHIIDSLHNEFDMTNLGALNYFLGIFGDRTSTGLFLSQRKYDLQLLERAHMVHCNPSRTPVDTESKLGPKGVPVQDPRYIRSLAGGYTKRQHTISRSSVEAEYHGVANVVAETAWLRNLLRELHSPLSTVTLVYSDNVSAVYMSVNPVQHQRTKHIEIDIHFVCDMVTAGQVRVLHVLSRYQYANIFTKGLPSTLFEEFRSSLSVRPSPAPTAGTY
ncbi:ribonuclease H-like domain-containing protein [Tanacetum coccineum]